jgi:2-methylisocitrate lyase-like PEP mutase family enzyme
MMRGSRQLRELLRAGDVVVAPGVWDGLSARLVTRAGFPAAYATGGGIARSMGYPDLGLLSLSEIASRLANIVEHAGVPVIADADTGYGNALNAQRAVREFERAGVAGLHLEDQTFPKRCGHYDDKSVVPTAEMAQKLRAARDAMTDSDIVLIARTDALAVEGLDAAVERTSLRGGGRRCDLHRGAGEHGADRGDRAPRAPAQADQHVPGRQDSPRARGPAEGPRLSDRHHSL